MGRGRRKTTKPNQGTMRVSDCQCHTSLENRDVPVTAQR